MTLIKSILLGSAAGLVAVASAQAADLPTRKAAPVEYVKVCNVGGITGWTMPGSDTCVKFSGYMTAHFIAGNIANQYNSASAQVSTGALFPGLAAALGDPNGTISLRSLWFRAAIRRPQRRRGHHSQDPPGYRSSMARPSRFLWPAPPSPGAAIPGAVLAAAKNSVFNRNAIGWNIRANFGFDLASNTAYGPLIGHFDLNSDLGSGLDSPNGSFTYVNTGYVTWAGITAGKAQSFYSFIGGGDNWNNFFSPDREGLQRAAYAGLHRLVRRRLHGDARCSKPRHSRRLRRRHQHEWRVIAGRRRWPGLHRSHDVWRRALARHRRRSALQVGVGRGPGLRRDPQRQRSGITTTSRRQLRGHRPRHLRSEQGKVGWGIDAGVKYNLTGWSFWGAGDDVILTGSYTRNAVWYSGIPDAMNGENGQVNGNGQPMILADCILQSADQLVVDPDRLVRLRVV